MALTFDDIKKLPPLQKGLIIALILIVLGYLYYLFFLEGALRKLGDLSAQLTELEQQIKEKEKAAAKLEAYKKEVADLKTSFQQALEKLPNEREIGGLLQSVERSGRTAGVKFLLFEPKLPEKKPPETKPAAKPADPKAPPAAQAKEPPKFYDEIPIKVQVTGGFHSTLAFFEEVGRLPRIVNIEEITMGDSQEVKGRGRIVKTSCTMKTYMFVDRK